MNRFRASGIAVVAGMLAVASVGPAAAGPRAREIPFSLDAASFPDSLDGAVVHVYLTIPLTSLRFVDDGSGTGRADLEVSIVCEDRKGRRLDGDDWSYRRIPGSLSRDGNEGRSITRRHLFRLPPGEARIEVRARVPESDLESRQALEIKVPDYADAPFRVSDLAFGVCGDLVVSAPAGNFEGPVLPHPSRRYGDDVPVLCVYALARDTLAAADTAYVVRAGIKEGGGRSIQDTTFTAPRVSGRGGILYRPDISRLAMGDYRLTLETILAGHRVRREGAFSIDESRLSFFHDGQMLRTVLSYVATNDELIALEDSPDDSLEAIWSRFWARRDPDPGSGVNEALVEFMRRVEYATRNFGVLEPGWRSDMGRIYIRFGPPDQVDRAVMQLGGYPTEVWSYYGRNATYVFQDQDGFGRYRLVGTRRD